MGKCSSGVCLGVNIFYTAFFCGGGDSCFHQLLEVIRIQMLSFWCGISSKSSRVKATRQLYKLLRNFFLFFFFEASGPVFHTVFCKVGCSFHKTCTPSGRSTKELNYFWKLLEKSWNSASRPQWDRRMSPVLSAQLFLCQWQREATDGWCGVAQCGLIINSVLCCRGALDGCCMTSVRLNWCLSSFFFFLQPPPLSTVCSLLISSLSRLSAAPPTLPQRCTSGVIMDHVNASGDTAGQPLLRRARPTGAPPSNHIGIPAMPPSRSLLT